MRLTRAPACSEYDAATSSISPAADAFRAIVEGIGERAKAPSSMPAGAVSPTIGDIRSE